MKNIITGTYNHGGDAALVTISQRILSSLKSNAQFQSLSELVNGVEKSP